MTAMSAAVTNADCKKLYIAGRIADEPDYRMKFARACTEVALLGYKPVSPCDGHGNCAHKQWSEWMVCDLHLMLDCCGVYALRDWSWSKGATIEIQLAMRLGKEIIYQADYAEPSYDSTVLAIRSQAQ